MKYIINCGDKKSKTFYFIEDLIIQYINIDRFLIEIPN